MPRIDIDEPSLLVVVGGSLHAEVFDRPTATRLAERAGAVIEAAAGPDAAAALVCTDLWYLNQPQLRLAPTVAVGGPEHNALAAYLIGRVPVVFAVEGRYAVHADPDLRQLMAVAWGVDGPNTAAACEAFSLRWLEPFIGALVGAR